MFLLIAIFLAVLVGAFATEHALRVRDALTPAFALTMFLTGTLISFADVRSALRQRQKLIMGLLGQFVVMPILAWALSRLVDEPIVRSGIVLLGCMPTAMASNMMTVLFGGDIAVAVVLTTIGTILSPLVIMVVLPPLLGITMTVPVLPMAWTTTSIVVLPVIAGIAARFCVANPPAWWRRIATTMSSMNIVFIVSIVVAQNRANLDSLDMRLGTILLLLNLGGYLVAFLLGKLLRWPASVRRTLVINVGMKNAGMGAIIALDHLGAKASIPSAAYGVFGLITVALALPLHAADPLQREVT